MKMDLLKIAVIAIIVVVVIAVIAMVWAMMRKSGDSRSSSSNSSQSSQNSSGSSSSNGHRFHAHAPRGQSRYTVTKGKLVEEQQEVHAAAPAQQAQAQEFPRHAAQAGNRVSEHRAMAQEASRFQVQAPVQTQSQESSQRFEVMSEGARSVTVERVADLFSVRRNVEAELGVTEEEMDRMVAAYRKKSEYRERRLPVNQHFNLDDYKDSKKVMRESANVGATFKGSKRGTITGEVYKVYGKNATKNRVASNADVMSMEVDADRHEAHLAKIRERRANGYLEVRN